MDAENAQMVVESQAQTGVEPTYCMGDDIPLAVLSDKPHMLYDYFKQRFAQVGRGLRAAGWPGWQRCSAGTRCHGKGLELELTDTPNCTTELVRVRLCCPCPPGDQPAHRPAA